jgi:hypothetical protein
MATCRRCGEVEPVERGKFRLCPKCGRNIPLTPAELWTKAQRGEIVVKSKPVQHKDMIPDAQEDLL